MQRKTLEEATGALGTPPRPGLIWSEETRRILATRKRSSAVEAWLAALAVGDAGLGEAEELGHLDLALPAHRRELFVDGVPYPLLDVSFAKADTPSPAWPALWGWISAGLG